MNVKFSFLLDNKKDDSRSLAWELDEDLSYIPRLDDIVSFSTDKKTFAFYVGDSEALAITGRVDKVVFHLDDHTFWVQMRDESLDGGYLTSEEQAAARADGWAVE